eukprot:2986581-Rhodomonas_salina.1
MLEGSGCLRRGCAQTQSCTPSLSPTAKVSRLPADAFLPKSVNDVTKPLVGPTEAVARMVPSTEAEADPSLVVLVVLTREYAA